MIQNLYGKSYFQSFLIGYCSLSGCGKDEGGYPERIGQPECQYYLKTGTCKFGPTCKFHHPKEKAGITGRVQLNVAGYPLRPDEKECAYYLRTGQCKFGNTCKFHHPQPSNAMFSLRGSPVYPSVPTATTPGQQSFTGSLTNWPLSKLLFIASARWQGPSSFAQLIVPQGLVQVPSWNTFTGQLGSASSSDSQQPNSGTSQFYGTPFQSETTASSSTSLSPLRLGSVPVRQYALQRDNIFPERPDEPECQFYMKTGDCKFGAVCRFHHPKERIIPAPNCMLSPLGLPLRPVKPLCIFTHAMASANLAQTVSLITRWLLQWASLLMVSLLHRHLMLLLLVDYWLHHLGFPD
ncbi:hypothetical protein HPP92_003544 [Vanilla planifolia]|uniref:C3H1-type domain-containing protein n=1 Tax=Vanilla planifolia TaxID=51239 RepID=A0A835RXT5_VANPL|nr:hypothetical protein HPP92_003544 [Vanilla planifolia]